MSGTLQDDIDYMKSLAEEGRRRPVLNGGALFWAGICFGAASLMHYALVVGSLPNFDGMAYLATWLSAGIIYGLLCWLSVSASIRRYGPAGEMNRTIGSIWSGIGVAVFAIAMCLIVAGSATKVMDQVMSVMAPAVLVLYALGWWVVSDVARQGWLRVVSLGTFVGAIGISFLGGQPEQLLAYTACLLLFATGPGIVLMRAEKGKS